MREETDPAWATVDLLEKVLIRLDSIERLLDAGLRAPTPPCPYPHYPFPSIYQPLPPYISWTVTCTPPITGSGVDGMGGFPKQPESGSA